MYYEIDPLLKKHIPLFGNITGSATSGGMLRCTAQRDGTNSRREKKKRLHSATRAMDKIYSGELTEGAHAKLTFSYEFAYREDACKDAQGADHLGDAVVW
uniref:Uncharacterized protein n=1 Tax=Triticum urartu TaxID=4572 RepID=A0A8R7PNG7_TRIUA